jgi:hypothetical protein
MTLFQIIGLPLIVVMVLVSGVNLIRRRSSLAVGTFWLLLWAAAGVAIAVPDATTTVAHALGILRGADLVFYCAVLGGFVGFFLIYVRLRELSRQITVLTRDLALRHAIEPAPARELPPHDPAG